MTKITWIDPPSGFKYGFPKQLPDNVTNLREWLLENGYPQSMIDQFPDGVPCGIQTQTIEE